MFNNKIVIKQIILNLILAFFVFVVIFLHNKNIGIWMGIAPFILSGIIASFIENTTDDKILLVGKRILNSTIFSFWICIMFFIQCAIMDGNGITSIAAVKSLSFLSIFLFLIFVSMYLVGFLLGIVISDIMTI